MKKILLIVTAIVAVSLTGCENTVNYKAEGEKMAKELDRLCELKDSAAVVAFDDSIHAVEDRIVAKGDTLAIKQFREALLDARTRNAAYVASLRMKKGTDKEEIVKEMAEDVMNGGMDISSITSAIDEMNGAPAK